LVFHPITGERNGPIKLASLSKHSTIASVKVPISITTKQTLLLQQQGSSRILLCSSVLHAIIYNTSPIKASSSPLTPEAQFR